MLLDALQTARRAADITRIFVELGYRPADVAYGSDARIVARWHRFIVVALDGLPPPERVRALARRMGTAGERGLAIGIGPECIAVAAPRPGVGGATRAIMYDRALPSPLTIAQLEALAPRRGQTALQHSLHVAEVLSTEAVGDRFFRGFRRIWRRMADALPRSTSEKERRLAVLHSLIRVLFLYFVQAKGWLANDPRYLRSLLDRTLASGGSFHRRALEPLFFGTLNLHPNERRIPVSEDIPYLNGGLFRQHPVERRLGGVCLPDELWVDAFEQVFDRYHFCVHESQRVDAVAPDMLGRVFERLMDASERSTSGSYFTPDAIVRGVVREGLTATLGYSDQLTPAAALRIMDDGSITSVERLHARRVLSRIRILDPAVGSGAFLLGALDELTHLTVRLSPGEARHRGPLRRRILRDNLFGIDLNPIAVRLAELRLWIAVVADDPSTTAPDVAPLPNLDGVVRQGNTLLDPLGAARAHAVFPASATAELTRRVAEARTRLFDTQGQETRAAISGLRKHEIVLAGALLAKAMRSCTAALTELESVAASHDLFGQRNRLSPSQQAKRRALRDDLRALERTAASLEDGALPFFSFEVHAPEVLQAGGFDLVVGNPPWVRAERIPPRDRAALRQRFRLWRATEHRGFRHLPDLAVAFVERALELVRPGGALALLLPSKVASAAYATELRRHLAASTTITCLHRIPDSEANSFGATTYPLAVITRTVSPNPSNAIRLGLGSDERASQRHFMRPGPWILVPDRTRDAVETLRSSGAALREVAPPHLGVKTGADCIFVGEPLGSDGRTVSLRSPTGRMVTLEREVLRHAVRGRDVGPFDVRSRRMVLWAYQRSGIARSALPPRAAEFIAAHADLLASRTDYRGGPLWTLFRTDPALSPHRLIWRDIARRPTAAVLDEQLADAIPLNTCYVASFPDRSMALAASAVLNSLWAAAFVRVVADEARGGYRRCNAQVIGSVPLPRAHAVRQSLADLAGHAHRTSHTSDDDLDAAVAAALDLPRSAQDRLRTLVPDPG